MGAITLPYHKHLPSYQKNYQNTPENIKKIANKVARLYAIFLTEEAHDSTGNLHCIMREMKIHLIPSMTEPPSKEQVERFEELLCSKIESELSSPKRSPFGHYVAKVRLGTDYPDLKFLENVVQDSLKDKVQDNYLRFFPCKSTATITAIDNEITLIISFRSSQV